MDFNALLGLMVQKNAFDLFLTVDRPPTLKIDQTYVEVSKKSLSKEQTNALLMSLLNTRQKEEFLEKKECLFALSIPKIGHFRVSAYIQRDAVGMVLRRIREDIPDISELNLPPIVKKLIMEKHGLVLLAGVLGSGKSYALASMIKYRNQNANGHVVVLDHPMEFLHSHSKSIITQREIGVDSDSYDIALKNISEQAPDVLSISELCSSEITQSVIQLVERGALCISTIRARNAEHVMERILNFFPDTMHHRRIRTEIAMNLTAIISLRVLHCANGQAIRITEVLLATPSVKEAIRRGEFSHFHKLISQGNHLGMQSFDQSLYHLCLNDKISYDEAIEFAEYKNEFRQIIKQMPTIESQETNNITAAETVGVITTKEMSQKKAHQKDSKLDNANSDKTPTLPDFSDMTLSDVHDESSDAGSIFTRR
jgi:twitching motility protein PilU